jgi:hypothetical protein
MMGDTPCNLHDLPAVGEVGHALYLGHLLVTHVTHAGSRLKHKLLSIANALKEQHIGLDETDDASGRSTAGRSCSPRSTNAT